MTIAESLAGKVATGRTFFSAFAGPCLWLAGFAALAGIGIGAYGMHRWDKGNMEELRADKILAEKQLSDFKVEIAAQSSTIRGGLIKDIQASADAQRARDQAITAAIDNIGAKLDKSMAAKFASLGSMLNAPKYDCVRTTVLPVEFLRALEQPAGNALGNGSVREDEIR